MQRAIDYAIPTSIALLSGLAIYNYSLGYLFLLMGFGSGYLLSLTASHTSFDLVESIARQRIENLNQKKSDGESLYSDNEQVSHYSESIEQSLEEIINCILHHQINSWYQNYDHSKSNHFQNAVKSSLRVALLELLKIISKAHAASVIVVIVRTFLRHLKEYRKFDKSRLTLTEYRKQHPESIFNVYKNEKIKNDMLLELAMALCIKVLPKTDRSNEIVLTIVQELLATTIFVKIIEKLGDPDVLNHILNILLTPNTVSSSLVSAEVGPEFKYLPSDVIPSPRENDLSIYSMLKSGEAIVEFMEFMKAEKAYALVQFFFMVDAYRRVCEWTEHQYKDQHSQRIDQMSLDALEVYDAFFGLSPEFQMDLPDVTPDVLNSIRLRISESPDASVFDPILKIVLKKMEQVYLPKFKSTDVYKKYLTNQESLEVPSSPLIPRNSVQRDHSATSPRSPRVSISKTPLGSFHDLSPESQSDALLYFKKSITSLSEKIDSIESQLSETRNESEIKSLTKSKAELEKEMQTMVDQMPESALKPTQSDVLPKPRKESVEFTCSDPCKESLKRVAKAFANAGNKIKDTILLPVSSHHHKEHTKEQVKNKKDDTSPPVITRKSAIKDKEKSLQTDFMESIMDMKRSHSDVSVVLHENPLGLFEDSSSTSLKNTTSQRNELALVKDQRRSSDTPASPQLQSASAFSVDTLKRKTTTTPSQTKSSTMRKAELETILDSAFGAIEEIFHLTTATNWIRHQGLHFIKTILRNTYGSTISSMIQDYLNKFTAEESIVGYLDKLRKLVWAVDGDTPPRTDTEKQETQRQVKRLLLKAPSNSMLGTGIDKVQTIVGHYNAILGLNRVFNMFQNEELNQLLFLNILQVLIQTIL